MQNNIGETICQYRQMRKMTQEEFASRIGVTAQAVSKWERGNGLPDVSLLAGICGVLGISASSLIGADEKVVENGNLAAEREIKNNMIAEPLVLEVGAGLIPCVESGIKTDYVNQKRISLVKKTGKLMPVLRIRDNTELRESEYRVLVFDNPLFNAVIEDESANKAEDKTKEIYEQIIDDVTEVCDKHYAVILNKNLVKIMIDNVSERYPGVVDDIIPSKISYLQVSQELKRLIEEGKNIRNLLGILEDMEMKL